MAHLVSLGLVRHVRGEPTAHLMHVKRGRVKQSGRGLAFWFVPLGSNLIEVPLDDRELPFLFRGRSRDHQEVTVQGVVTFRAAHAEVLAERVNFAIDPATGKYIEEPLERLAGVVAQLAQQLATDLLARAPLAELLDEGLEGIRRVIHEGLVNDQGLQDMGLEIVASRVKALSPAAEVERALQMPTREAIQQRADEATFQRRALAVEKERAIAENELQNRIELSKREELLIAQQGQNARSKATEAAEAARIEAEAGAGRIKLRAGARAEATTLLERALVEAERERMAIAKGLPTEVLLGLAARELAGKLQRIDHLNLSPDVFGPLLTRVLEAGAAKLEAGGAGSSPAVAARGA